MEVKEKDLRILSELLGSARRSDRELAKALGVSQPTVSRQRTRLEKEGYIKEYTIIPNLRKMGFELLVFTFMSFAEDRPDLFNKAREWVKNQPCVIFANNGEGPGMNSIMLSIHKNYSGYTRLITELRRDWQPNLTNLQSFVISLDRTDQNIRDFSFRHLLVDKSGNTEK